MKHFHPGRIGILGIDRPHQTRSQAARERTLADLSRFNWRLIWIWVGAAMVAAFAICT